MSFMATPNLDQEIRARIQSFADELAELVKRAALESVRSALGGGAVSAPVRQRRAAPARARRGGGKRSPEAIEELANKLFAHIKSNPGQRIEQIGGALGAPTKDLALPVIKLLKQKKIKTTGHRRATKYFKR
jgi:hypothetical protein